MTDTVSIRSLSLMKLRQMMTRVGGTTKPQAPASNAVVFDWTVPHHFKTEQMEEILLLGRRIAAAFESALGQHCQGQIEVSFSDAKERSANQLMQELTGQESKPHQLVFKDDAKQSIGLMGVSFNSVVSMVAQVLNDPEAAIGEEGQLSVLEESMLSDMLGFLAEALREVMKECVGMMIRPDDRPFQGEWKLRAQEHEDMCEFQFEFIFGEETRPFSVVIESRELDSYAGVETISAESSDLSAQKILGQIRSAPVSVSACMHTASIGMHDLMNLKQGDIVLLQKKINHPLELQVNGRTCYHAYPAAQNGKLALVITEKQDDLG